MELIWNYKKVCVFLKCLRFKKKKLVLKRLDRTVYWTSRQFLSGTPYHGHIPFHVTYHREKRIDLLTLLGMFLVPKQPNLFNYYLLHLKYYICQPLRSLDYFIQDSNPVAWCRYVSRKIEFGEWIPVKLTILNINHTKQPTQSFASMWRKNKVRWDRQAVPKRR